MVPDMTASLASHPSPLVPESGPVSFSGRGRAFLKLLVTGSLLQIPTFGFYRFWLITKLRRHLWSNTQVGGEAFEYTGTAKELLIGFLIALAVLIPIYLGYFLLGIFLEEKAAFASLPLILIVYPLMHFATYRARRYRATRTVFRGIRFWMKGSGWAYAFRAILWDIATLLTLGLALPWAMASLERYRMRHSYFGSLQGDFTGTGWTLFKRGAWVWALGFAMLLGPALIFGAIMGFSHPGGEPLLQLIPLLLILVPLALWPLAMAIFSRWQIEGIRFGDVSVSSDLGKGAFYGTFIKLISSSIGLVLIFGVSMIIGFILTKDRIEALKAGSITWDTGGLIALIALAYLALLLGMGIIQRYFMGRGLWAVIVNSTVVSNPSAVDAAVAAGQPSGVMGEGLADALDFSVGL
jgi:uncharacterized membrane protein YjgN (DUF898 family)